MAIPALNADGFLPEGVHDCTTTELRERFGQFQRTDHRCRLIERFDAYFKDAKASGVVIAIIVNGSFVTAKDNPGDIDLIVVARQVLPANLRPQEYNVLSRRHVRRNFGMDILLAHEGLPEIDEYIAFFSQVRNRTELRKGMLRITL